MNLFNNILNKIKRRSTQISFSKRSKEQHSQIRDTNKFNKEGTKKYFKLLPEIKIRWKYILIPLLILLTIAVGYYVFLFAKAWIEFNPKTYNGNTTENTFTWDGSTKLTILLVGTDKIDQEHVFIDALAIYSVDPVNNDLTVFTINPDLKIYLASIGKDVNFRTMLNDKTLPADKMVVLKNAVSTLLAIKIDRYILIDKADINTFASNLNPVRVNISKAIKDPDTATLPGGKYISWNNGDNQIIWGSEFLSFMASDSNGRDDQLSRQQDLLAAIPFYQVSLRSILNFPGIINNLNKAMYSDLSKSEIEMAIAKTLNIKESDIKKGYTREATYSRVSSVSFYPVFTPDLDQIDSDVYNIFFDMSIFKEQAKIEILNSSGIKGLASNRARWIVNLGGRVVKVGNGFSNQDVTKIYCENPKNYANTILSLQRIFNNKAEIVAGDYPNRHVGDIVIELGKTFE